MERRSARVGGIGALVAAATFIFGIALFATTFLDYTSGDPTPAESVAFVGDHETAFFVWYLVIFLVFGAAIIPLARALHGRLQSTSPLLADIGAVFAYIWAGLMFATGMISNIGIVFGLGLIIWFAWVGIVLVRTDTNAHTGAVDDARLG
ncbi:MAG: hypothetical protein AAGA93_06790 [Actinomycetota bacterium]